MGRENKSVITIDVGSCTVRVVAAQRHPAGGIQVLGIGQAPTLGIQRGIVDSIDDASFAIRAALQDAALDAKARGAAVYVSLAGKHVASMNHCGEVYTTRNDGLVTTRDLARAIEASKVVELPADTRIIHVIPKIFRVDGYVCRRDPVGMHGGTIGAESHTITASATATKNLKKAIQMAGQEVDGFIVSGVAASQAVLTAEEKEMGVILVDIGGGTTDIVGYWGGSPFHTSSLPVAGNQIANDIAIALNTSFHVAERLYCEEGSGSTEGIDPAEELTVPCFGLTGTRTLRRLYLNEVINLRLTEIFRLARLRVEQAAPELPMAAGAVVTGGVARLPDIEALAQQALELPVRLGKPVEVDGVSEELADPSFATAVGTMWLASDPASDILKAQRNGTTHSPFRLLPRLHGLRA